MTETLVPTAADLVAAAGDSISPERARLIEEAYEFAHEAHDGQNRATGDPYIVHPIDAAMTVADLNLDGAAIAAALLHDVVEDCGVSNEEISKRFGADVARLVEGVTKLSRLNLLRPEDAALGRRRPGRQPAQDVPGDGGGHPRRRDQAGGPAAQHAHAARPGARQAAADRPRDDGDLRAAGAAAGPGPDRARAGRPGVRVPGAGELQAHLRPADGEPAIARALRGAGREAAALRAEPRRHRGGALGARQVDLTASTRRCRSTPRWASRSTTSTTCWRSASWCIRWRTATTRWASCTACGGRCRACSTTTSPTRARTSTSRCTRR